MLNCILGHKSWIISYIAYDTHPVHVHLVIYCAKAAIGRPRRWVKTNKASVYHKYQISFDYYQQTNKPSVYHKYLISFDYYYQQVVMILQYWQSGVFPYWSEVFDERNKKPLKVSSYRDQSTKDDSVQCIARVNIFLAIKILMDFTCRI